MVFVESMLQSVKAFMWGPPILVVLLGTGLFLMCALRFMPFFRLGMAFKMLWSGRGAGHGHDGELSPFNALMTALAATIGTGNIAGVATAVFTGGPGAIFWMWCTALVGMATKFSECTLSVHFREVTSDGSYVGGPMYYIKNGLGKNWLWLASAFAFFGSFACFGIGNTTQGNSIAEAFLGTFNIPKVYTALVLTVFVGLVILGGVERIGKVAGKIVPFMAVSYCLGALVVLALNAAQVPQAFWLIFQEAFTPTAAQGGFAGASVMMAIQNGVARGVFSNEAGMGSAPIAHATARTNSAVRQGLIGMLGTFIDTIIVCTMTGLVIVVTGVWTSGATGSQLTTKAFESSLPGVGAPLVALGLVFFAYTTILGWSVYGERCITYLLGPWAVKPFRIVYTLAVPFGALAHLDFVWLLADVLNAFMIIPNLTALLLLSPLVISLTREYFAAQ